MPEIAFIWFVGSAVCFVGVNFNLWYVHRSFSDNKYKILNLNLQPLNLYWSIEQSRLIPISRDSSIKSLRQVDYKKATRSAFLFGSMMLPLSWLGFLLLGTYFFSANYFAKSRLEHNIFESDLSQKLLPEARTRILIHEFCDLAGVKIP